MAVDEFVGAIRMFAFPWAPPPQFAQCNGQLLPIASNEMLYAVIGTTFGGNGVTNFALPDLRGKLPVHRGQGDGLSNWSFGQAKGEYSVVLNEATLPSHNHSLVVSKDFGTQTVPTNQLLAQPEDDLPLFYTGTETSTPQYVSMSSKAISTVGGYSNEGHLNIMPCLAINFAIAVQGIFPTRAN